MHSIVDVDIEAELATQIAAVAASGGAVELIGSGSKRFYGEVAASAFMVKRSTP